MEKEGRRVEREEEKRHYDGKRHNRKKMRRKEGL